MKANDEKTLRELLLEFYHLRQSLNSVGLSFTSCERMKRVQEILDSEYSTESVERTISEI